MASGSIVSGLNPDYYVSIKGNQNLQVGNLVLSVHTDIDRNIYLPKMSTLARFATGTIHIYIVDVTGGAATHNILVYPDATDQINSGGLGVPLVISANNAVVDILSVGIGNWTTALYAGASGGGGGNTLTPITYASLVALAGAAGLVQGAFYLITDFQMATYIQFSGGGLGLEDVYLGAVEPMIAQASSTTDLNNSIISTLYPQDAITWQLNFTDREYDAVLGQSTGIITSREDTVLKIKRDFDFRNIIFRRWETINGSGIFDSWLNTGFAFTDYPPFAAGTSFDCYIGSPLQFGAGFGFVYYLDNTIGKATTSAMNIEMAYCNNIETDFDSNGTFKWLFLNTISTSLVYNDCSVIQRNTVIRIEGNFGGAIVDNSGNLIIEGNDVSASINNNTFAGTITRNQCFSIDSNTSPFVPCVINENIAIEINQNNGFTNISTNNVAFINANSGDGVFACEIIGNTGQTINNNSNISTAVDSGIYGNNINTIQNCNLPTNSIRNCVGNICQIDIALCDGDFEGNSFVLLYAVFIGIGGGATGIQNNSFQANILSATITPTPAIASILQTVTTFDLAKGNCELIINNAVVSTTAI